MKSLIYATDYSKASLAALHCAQAMSRLLSMRLIVTHVYDVPTVLGTQLDGAFPELKRDAHKHETEKLQQFYQDHKSNDPDPEELRIEPVENMSVLSGIIAKATEWHANLVVVGMKGESALRELLIGSTTKKLIDKAPCPVLAIPANHRFEDIRSMVYATDFELEDLRALEKVVALAEVFDAEVRVVHVTNDREYAGPSQMEWFKSMARERIQYDRIHFELLESRDIPNSLKDYTAHLNAGIIGMLERRGKEGVSKWFRRDLVKQMASQSNIPLLSFNEQNLQTLFF